MCVCVCMCVMELEKVTFFMLLSTAVNTDGGNIALIWRGNLHFGERYQQLRFLCIIVVNMDGICEKIIFKISSITYEFSYGTVVVKHKSNGISWRR